MAKLGARWDHTVPCYASHVPNGAPCAGDPRGGLVSQVAQRLHKQIFRDFCFAGWEVAAARLAKDLAADRTFECRGTVVMFSAGFWAPPKHGADCRGSSVIGTFPVASTAP